jgi:hypothetical protein
MSNGLNNLSKLEKQAYLKAVLSGDIKPPRNYYSQVIISDKDLKRTTRGDELNKNFFENLPHQTVIILPDNGRETGVKEAS